MCLPASGLRHVDSGPGGCVDTRREWTGWKTAVSAGEDHTRQSYSMHIDSGGGLAVGGAVLDDCKVPVPHKVPYVGAGGVDNAPADAAPSGSRTKIEGGTAVTDVLSGTLSHVAAIEDRDARGRRKRTGPQLARRHPAYEIAGTGVAVAAVAASVAMRPHLYCESLVAMPGTLIRNMGRLRRIVLGCPSPVPASSQPLPWPPLVTEIGISDLHHQQFPPQRPHSPYSSTVGGGWV